MLKNLFNKLFGKEETADKAVENEPENAEPSLLQRIPDGVTITSMKQAEQYFPKNSEFAAAIGVTFKMVSFWKQGKQKISAKVAKRTLIQTQGKVDLFKFDEFGG